MIARLSAPWMQLALACVLALASAVAPAQSSSRLDLQLSQGIGVAGAPAVAAPQAASASAVGEPISAGDSITVTVYQEPDLGLTDQKVRADGTLSLPLIGELHVEGLTSKQLQKLITGRLADGYLKQPSVTVNVTKHRFYYITGEVESPGGYAFAVGLTIEQAIVLAGGYTERASRNAITVVRESSPDRPVEGVALSSSVMPGDIITVKESFF